MWWSALVLACGEPPPERAAGPVSAPGHEVEEEAPNDPPPPPHVAVAPPAESCEGLARWCGGWTGCIHVSERRDADGTLHYDGLGEVRGHAYIPDARCAAGEPCNDMCDPATGLCRPGVLEDLPETCSRSGGPSRAPFYCELVEGRCTQHDLPPPAVHAGGRS